MKTLTPLIGSVLIFTACVPTPLIANEEEISLEKYSSLSTNMQFIAKDAVEYIHILDKILPAPNLQGNDKKKHSGFIR